MGVLPKAPLVADALVVRAQALDAEVEAHAIVVEAHRQTRGPDSFRTRTRQLESHARRDGFLEEGGEGTT